MKVLSLNFWNGGRLLTAALEFIDQIQPDLLLAQEVYNGHQADFAARFKTVEEITKVLPQHDLAFAAAYLDDRTKEGQIEDGNAIFSRYKITPQPTIFFDEPYGVYSQDETTDFSQFPAGAQHVQIEINHQTFDIYNVHGPWNLNGDEDSIRRQNMSRSLISEIKGKTHIIMAGDFNARPTVPSTQQLIAQLHDVFAGQLTTTFNMQQKTNPGYATSVVDLFLTSPNLKIINHSQPQVNVSDHLPLLVELDI